MRIAIVNWSKPEAEGVETYPDGWRCALPQIIICSRVTLLRHVERCRALLKSSLCRQLHAAKSSESSNWRRWPR